jgi:hypothetical protein
LQFLVINTTSSTISTVDATNTTFSDNSDNTTITTSISMNYAGNEEFACTHSKTKMYCAFLSFIIEFDPATLILKQYGRYYFHRTPIYGRYYCSCVEFNSKGDIFIIGALASSISTQMS